MRGISNEVMMNIIWIILAMVAVAGIFFAGQYIFELMQPVKIDVENSGMKYDGVTGSYCAEATGSGGCARCVPMPVTGQCSNTQYVDVSQKFGDIVVSEVKVCAIAVTAPSRAEFAFTALYGDNQKSEATASGQSGAEVCKTFDFPEGALLREASATLGSSGSVKRFSMEFKVQEAVTGG